MNNPRILIQEILKDAKWTQDELAHHLGLPLKTVNSWATGRNKPHAKNFNKLYDLYLGISGRDEVSKTSLADLKSQATKTRLDLRELTTNEELLRLTTIHLTYHTNTIEGSTLTIEDVTTILENENAILPNKSYREQAEARNHRATLLFLLEQLKFQGKNFKWSEDLILEIHQRLMNGIMDDAGKYRTYGVRVIGSSVARANYASIPVKIRELIKSLNTKDKDIINHLAETHAIFERIHPFGDGNGRTGRLIMFAQALQYGIVPPIIEKERKRAYYKYLEEANKKEDYDLLSMFIAESILSTDKLLK